MTSFIPNEHRPTLPRRYYKKNTSRVVSPFFVNFIRKRIEEIVKEVQETVDKDWNNVNKLRALDDVLNFNIDLFNKLIDLKKTHPLTKKGLL